MTPSKPLSQMTPDERARFNAAYRDWDNTNRQMQQEPQRQEEARLRAEEQRMRAQEERMRAEAAQRDARMRAEEERMRAQEQSFRQPPPTPEPPMPGRAAGAFMRRAPVTNTGRAAGAFGAPPMPQAGPPGSMGTPPMGSVNTRGMGPSAAPPPSTNVTTQQDMMGRPAFKKGGAVKAKPKAAAPVKKKAGGMIAKPKVAAPKAKGKAMPAFKKGGAVKAKAKR